MKLFCANCGTKLTVTRKAVPKLGIILDLVTPHECLETPVDPTQVIVDAPITLDDRNKFVESLNGLKPSDLKKQFTGVGTDDLRDRRFEKAETKSSAPSSVLDQIRQLGNSIPANDLKDDPSDAEMGG